MHLEEDNNCSHKVIYKRVNGLRVFWEFCNSLEEAEQAAERCYDKLGKYGVTILIYDRAGNIVG